MAVMNCPNNHGEMIREKKMKTVTLACNIWDYDADFHVCPVCGMEIEADEVNVPSCRLKNKTT